MEEGKTKSFDTNAVPVLVGEREISKTLNVSVSFLQKDRATRQTIPFIKLGDRCLYDLDVVLAAVRALTIGGNKPNASRIQRRSLGRGRG